MKLAQIQALRWAVDQAKLWRGSLTDREDRAEFDAFIAEAKEAVAQAGRDLTELRALRREVGELRSRVVAMKSG